MSLLALVGAAFLAVQPDAAAQFVVSTEAELRAAFSDASETEITVAADITLADCTSTGGDLDRDSTTPLTIIGNGHTIAQSCTGEGVMTQINSGELVVDGLTVTGGNTMDTGGGIFAEGDLTVSNSTIRDNVSTAGGGITAGGQLTVRRSTISGNSATVGGGINNAGGVTVIDSTITNNTSATTSPGPPGGPATFGGGEFTGAGINSAGNVTVINSTVNGNTATIAGGIEAGGSVTLVYATVAGNISNIGGSAIGAGDLISFGSVVGLTQGGSDCSLGGQTSSHGYNFSSDDSCGFGSGPGDQAAAGDPSLGPLADNGGPTFTQSPQAGSPLLDTIPIAECQSGIAAGIATDQRGVTRPQGPACDIGSVEVVVDTPPPTAPELPVAPPASAIRASVIRFTG